MLREEVVGDRNEEVRGEEPLEMGRATHEGEAEVEDVFKKEGEVLVADTRPDVGEVIATETTLNERWHRAAAAGA